VYLRKITLIHFRNHGESNFLFNNKITCVVGKNGIGKTNLLDAVYYLCLTKSYLYADDKQNVKHNEDFFRLEGNMETDEGHFKIVCKYLSGRKKEFSVNEHIYAKLSEHVGRFPCVMICPADAEIITGGSEERRKVLDNTLSQTDPEYLNTLLQYNKVLAQRNAALKQFSERKKVDTSLLDIYNRTLVETGSCIYQKRLAAMEKILELYRTLSQQISPQPDSATLAFKSQLSGNNFQVLLEKNLEKDLALERTETGIHKDDIEFFLNNFPVKRYGSQGQQKTAMLSFKFAMYLYIKSKKGFCPLLLVDDVFDKLDRERSQNLMQLLLSDETGQVLITHTKSEDFAPSTRMEVVQM
jgi:DNA replication and repair protein RecF